MELNYWKKKNREPHWKQIKSTFYWASYLHDTREGSQQFNQDLHVANFGHLDHPLLE